MSKSKYTDMRVGTNAVGDACSRHITAASNIEKIAMK